MLQASKYYPNFNEILVESINTEMLFVKRAVLKSDNTSDEIIFKSLFALRIGVLMLDIYCPVDGILKDFSSKIVPLMKTNSINCS